MEKFEQSLDIRSLQLFVAVMESTSLTEAAVKLQVNQSKITYSLDKLRTFFDDPLLVRSGRSVIPTARASELLPQIRALLADLENLKNTQDFTPHTADIDYTIAANDFQREMLLPELYHRVRPLVASFHLRVVPSNLPDFSMLRDEQIDMVISPRVPDSSDIVQRKLYDFRENCYYDASQRHAPCDENDFAEAHYICPTFLLNNRAINLTPSQDRAVWLSDRVQIITYGFADAVSFLRGTDALAIAPPQLANKAFRGFSHVPFPDDSRNIMYLIWNKKFQKDSQHAWFREQLAAVASEIE